MPGKSSSDASAAQRRGAEPFLAMPSAAHFVRCLAASLVISVLFVVVYGGCDYLTSLHARRVRIDFGFEQQLPFWPQLSLIYSSLYLMFYMVPFVLRSKSELQTYVKMIAGVTVIAGICFLLFPAEVAFQLPTDPDSLPWTFRIADSLNLTYNLCPSLHVAYAALHAEVFRQKRPHAGWLFHLWAIAIALSAWLTYQHHLIDLVAGYMLGLLVVSTANGNVAFRPSRPVGRRSPPVRSGGAQ